GLLLVADDSIASTGLPFDRCDLFVVHEAADCADAQRRSNDVLLGVAARHARIVMTRTPRLRAAWTPTFPDVALAPDEPPADVEGLARMLADWFRGNMRA